MELRAILPVIRNLLACLYSTWDAILQCGAFDVLVYFDTSRIIAVTVVVAHLFVRSSQRLTSKPASRLFVVLFPSCSEVPHA